MSARKRMPLRPAIADRDFDDVGRQRGVEAAVT